MKKGARRRPKKHNRRANQHKLSKVGMDSRGIRYLLTGILLAAGITLSAIGITFMVQYKSTGVVYDNDGASYTVNVDGANLALEYKSEATNNVKLTTNVLQQSTGLGATNGASMRQVSCPGDELSCLEWNTPDDNLVEMKINKVKSSRLDAQVKCFEVKWTSVASYPPVDCFPMTGSWYGGAQMYQQYWPLNSWDKHMSFFLTGDMFSDPQQYGSVVERYWLNSDGVAIYVKPEVPLHVSTERGQLCLKGHDVEPYKPDMTYLNYVVCMSDSAQKTHRAILDLDFIARPEGLPDLRMMKSPIWSTWARYKVNINQSVVMDYAHEILDNGFTNSQIEIDDGYETRYGDHTFDAEKFPDASAMIRDLHDLDFRVTNWVTPFINPTSSNYDEGKVGGYYVMNGNKHESGLVLWWNGVGASIDFTEPAACDWYFSKLDDVRKTYGVDSFKFDAGELNYIYGIDNYELDVYPSNDPGYYTQKYVECVARFGYQIEVRAAWRNQNLPIFLRMMDKDSNWSYEKGLKTLIPTALTFSLIGYPYILPDMIGGNAYGDNGDLHETAKMPERQLYIRWLQITAFLPSMQFSISPWQYDDDVIELALAYVDLHETIIYDELVSASKEYMDGSADMGPIRPVWWVSMEDERAYDIDDQFMVGDRYLVAPIVDQNATSRDVYLPGPHYRDSVEEIWWRSMLRTDEDLVKGGQMLFDYPIALEEIAWWELVLK